MKTFNLQQQFTAIKTAAEEAVRNIFPVEGKQRKMVLDKVYIDDNIKENDYADQQKTKSKGGTWGVNLYADISLYDKASGDLLDRAVKTRLFLLPKITPRFSYIVNGNEYQVHNQLRLKAGAYNIKKQNGELKSHVNLAGGNGFDIVFSEQRAQFIITKIEGTQANIPLYPILTHLGISHSKIVDAWGTKIAETNKAIPNQDKAIEKAMTYFGAKKSTGLADYFSKTKMDPGVNKRTIGGDFDKVSGEMLLATSKKLLDVHLEKQAPDDRDSLEFKEIHSLDDFIKERLTKNKNTLEYRIKRSIDSPKRIKISQIINPGSFNSVISSFFTTDDKSSTPEQTNPLEMISGQWKATIMGSGGIQNIRSVTPEMREVHNSHFGYLDPIVTPESERIGATLSLSLGTVKDGNKLKKLVFTSNTDKSKAVYLEPSEAYEKKIAFSGQSGQMVKVMYKGNQIDVPRSEVDYWSRDPKTMFTWSSNLIPFLASNQGNRSMMAAKQMEQAISLKHREQPLVQVALNKNTTMEEKIGRELAIVSEYDGVVKKIDKDYVILKTKTGDVKINKYNNFTLNRKSFLHHEALVKVGDKVKKGQVIFDNNFTRDGVLALGTNLNTAYMTYHGYNHDDGIVITEAAAKKLTSEHIHKEEVGVDKNTILGLNRYRMQYPNSITARNAEKLDSDGVIKKGQKVAAGDIIITALQKREPLDQVGLVSKQLSQRPKDVSVTWTHEDEGEVIDIQKSGGKISVFIKTNECAKIGDKLAGRFGNKGIITKIIPDEHAPKTKSGTPVDIMLNPHGVVSRINIGQIYESAAGKASEKLGKKYVVENFSGANHLKETKDLLTKSKVNDKEDLIDPVSKKTLKGVHFGKSYVLKLYKQSQGNFSYRQGGPGSEYDANMQPLRQGGEESAKSLDMLTINSLLSHGARANLKDMMTVKSDKNDEYWMALKSGQMLPAPKTPFVYNKFLNYLKAAGIDVKKEGSVLSLAPLLDKQVLEMSKGEVKEPVFFRGKDMKPMRGGFMDPVKFGGMKGEKWGHIELKEPTVNPVFENAIKKITGLGTKYDEIMAGKLFVNNEGFNKEGKGLTGGEAIEKLLKKINVDEEINVIKKKISSLRGNPLDDANKKLRYLMALKENGIKPHEAYIRKYVPVIPPAYRPIYSLPDGNVTSSDANYLYKNLGMLNKLSKLPVYDMLTEDDKADLRKDIYSHVKGISGMTDVSIKGKEREGFISEIKGGSGGQPKEGFFISKMLGKKQDYVGRGTAIPEVSLGVDQVGIPEKMAWKLFEPFIVRELGRLGKNPIAAKKEIEDRTVLSRKVLERVMNDRHVLLKRDPSLHKFSIMSFKPTLTQGTAIKVQPLVNKGFNLDYDGDSHLNTILTFLTKPVIRLLKASLGHKKIKEHLMTARVKESLPILTEKGEVFAFNLSDFPHGNLLSSKIGKNGKIDFYEAIPGTKVIAYNEKTGKSSWQDVAAWSVHHDRKIELVNLWSGRQIITDDDERAVYGMLPDSLEMARRRPSESIGMMVPRVIKIGEEDNDGLKEINGYQLTKDFGYLIGSLVSNGWVETHHGVNTGNVFLCQVDKAVGEKFLKIAHKVFNFSGKDLKYERTYQKNTNAFGDSKKWGFLSLKASNLIEGYIGKRSENKHLPPFFLTACKEFREGLFAGLMDNDGGIGVSKAKKKPQLMANYSTVSTRLSMEFKLLAASLGIHAKINDSKTPDGKPFWMIFISTVDLTKWGFKHMVHTEKLARIASCKVDLECSSASGLDVVPITKELAVSIGRIVGAPRGADKDRHCLYQTLYKARTIGHITRNVALGLPKWAPLEICSKIPDFNKWWAIVQNKSITWDKVVEYVKTSMIETGYDLTVPGYETFMSVDGTILSNTMMVHVPVSDAANKESERFLPSNNIFQPGTGKIMLAPDQEAQTGLYKLSKTVKGRKLISGIVGRKYYKGGVLNKSAVSEMLKNIAKDLPPNEYSRIVNDLKNYGEKEVFESGFTLGVSDIEDTFAKRNKVVDFTKKMLKKARTQEDLARINGIASKLIDKIIDQKYANKDNPLYDMVASGAKGSKSQLRSIISTPVMVTDSRGQIVPQMIAKSYAEGLDTSDYWTSSYGARRGMMDRAVQTSLPGTFAKDIMASVIDNVISAKDCGTHKGIPMAINDTDVLDRFTAVDQHGVPRNTLIDTVLVSRLKKKKVKELLVRSPTTCMQAKGTCAKCFGLDEHGKEPPVGENVGAKSGQTISEPLTQMVMNSFHSGGTAGTKGQVGGYKRIDQLLKMPEIVTGSASLAPVKGIITKIQKGIGGGYDVTVGTKIVHVSSGLNLVVKKGDMVDAGDRLSDGVIKPQELVKLKGMHDAQNYVVDELKNSYKNQGVSLQRKIFETVVRSVGNLTKIRSDSKHTPLVPGDIAPYTLVQHFNENLVKDMPVDKCEGEVLAQDIAGLKKGHELSHKEIEALKRSGIKTIKIQLEKINHEPLLKGITSIPILKRNWMSALGYRDLKKVITEGAGQGWKTDIHDYHPIPGLAYGKEFGDGEDGKY